MTELYPQFQEAKPALEGANRTSPIKASVTKAYGIQNYAPILTFFIQKRWLAENMPAVATHVRFKYDLSNDVPVGLLIFGTMGTRLANAGTWSFKANFHGWPSLNAGNYHKRSDCPIISLKPDSVAIYIPPNRQIYNQNTGLWERATQ